jgi:hypothetical protein
MLVKIADAHPWSKKTYNGISAVRSRSDTRFTPRGAIPLQPYEAHALERKIGH